MNPLTVRAMMLVFCIWMVSCVSSCSEVLYYFNKQEAEAKITKIYEETHRGRHIGQHISYRFQHAETDEFERGGFVVDDADAINFAVGQTIPIEYRGSSPALSRLKGTNNSFWVTIFLVSSVLMIGLVAVMSYLSMQEEKRSSRR
ncbi:hypothetical protein HG15A2_48740 [Adhaeretor mobilis]|uniref:DUF3592 domain-containing protein n=1 Tax=Adhaeretor mobilis TaxID=1930276 RepID=A0A517N318_9BACT|nr:hypothetical protein HG15A2_48740 [Adhaeretor mobilis]